MLEVHEGISTTTAGCNCCQTGSRNHWRSALWEWHGIRHPTDESINKGRQIAGSSFMSSTCMVQTLTSRGWACVVLACVMPKPPNVRAERVKHVANMLLLLLTPYGGPVKGVADGWPVSCDGHDAASRVHTGSCRTCASTVNRAMLHVPSRTSFRHWVSLLEPPWSGTGSMINSMLPMLPSCSAKGERSSSRAWQHEDNPLSSSAVLLRTTTPYLQQNKEKK
ncbi:hypothetical protein J3F83DRAFT_624412 [Trichoderma novae-zelandiae]